MHFTINNNYSGLLQVGDRIVEVNGEMVDSMSPADLQLMLVLDVYYSSCIDIILVCRKTVQDL